MSRITLRTLRLSLVATLIGVLTAQIAIGAPGAVLKVPSAPAKGGGDKPTVVSAGDNSVSTQTGAFQYSFTIAVPPGRLGNAPSIGLQYSSQAPIYGSLAAGWSLTGFPEVRHDVSEGRQDSDYAFVIGGTTSAPIGAPDLAARSYVSDLAGANRLVAVEEPHSRGAGQTGVAKTYRAMFDSGYVQYRHMERHAEYVWEARTPSGRVMQFGHQSHIAGPLITSRAPLTRSIDKFGNTIDYYYQGGVDYTPTRIDYTRNPGAGLDEYHARVEFSFDEPSYCDGSAVPIGAQLDVGSGERVYRGARKLTKITTKARTATGGLRVVRVVELEYDAAAESCRERHGAQRQLVGVSQTAYDVAGQAVIVPPISFSYGPLERKFGQVKSLRLPSLTPDAPAGALVWGKRYNSSLVWPTVEAMLLDFDGDGFQDRLYVDPNDLVSAGNPDHSCSFRWQRGGPDGFAQASGPVFLPTLPWSGLNNMPVPGESCSLNGQRVFLENLPGEPSPCRGDASNAYFPVGWFPEGWFASDSKTFTPGNIGSYLSYRFLDVAGKDRRPDLVAALQYDTRYFAAHSGAAFEDIGLAQPSCSPRPGACPDLSDQDVGSLIDCTSGCNATTFECSVQQMQCKPAYDRFFDAVWQAPRVPCSVKTIRTPDVSGDPFSLTRCGQYRVEAPSAMTADGRVVDLEACRKGVVACDGGDGVGATCLPGDPVTDPTDQPLTTACKPSRFSQLACGEYVWHVWKNEGNGTLARDPASILSPVPLETTSGDSAVGGSKHGIVSAEQGILDLNGDGYLDVFTRDQHVRSGSDAVDERGGGLWWWVWFGDGNGNFRGVGDGKRTPYAWWVPPSAKPSASLEAPGFDTTGNSAVWWGAESYADSMTAMRAGVGKEGLYDVNGDGRPDYLRVNKDSGKVEVHYNTGLNFTFLDNDFSWLSQGTYGAITATRTTVAGWQSTTRWVSRARRSSLVGLVDVDADGRVDQFSPLVSPPTLSSVGISPSTSKPVIRMGMGGSMGRTVHALPTVGLTDSHGFDDVVRVDGNKWWVSRRYTDLTGDGRPDQFGFSPQATVTTDGADAASKPLRLMNAIDNGRGQRIEVRYAVHTDASVVTQDVAAGKATSNHTWVVKSVDVETRGNETATTTYHYTNPTIMPDWRGRHAFRGFEQVTSTSPSGSVSLERYGYDKDPTGRLVEQVTYAGTGEFNDATASEDKARMSRPHSIKRTHWKAHELFGRALTAYHPSAVQSWLCNKDGGTYQTKQQCEVSGARSATVTTWTPRRAPGGSELMVATEVFQLAGDVNRGGKTIDLYGYRYQDADRIKKTEYALDATEDVYRLRTMATELRQLAGDTLVARTEYVYDAQDLAPMDTRVLVSQQPEVWATTRVELDLTTGVPERVFKPTQVGGSAPGSTSGRFSELTYGPYKVFAIKAVNEQGHTVQTDTDYGTGVVIEVRGPNKKTVVDQALAGSVGVIFDDRRVDLRLPVARSESVTGVRARLGQLIDPGTFTPFPGGGGGGGTSTTRTVWQTRRVEIDGLGRPLAVYVSKDHAAEGYRMERVQTTLYFDGSPTVPATVTTKTRISAMDGWTESVTTFDAAGRVSMKTDVLSRDTLPDAVTRYRYDESGNLERIEVPDPSGGADRVSYTTTYDSLGRAIATRSPNGAGVDTVYDGRITTQTEYVPDSLDDSERPTPKAEKRLVTNGFGRMVRVQERLDDGSWATTHYAYDAGDRIKQIVDADSNVTDLYYDLAGRRTRIVRGNRVWRYSYNLDGGMTAVTTPGGSVTTKVYDVLGRVTSTWSTAALSDAEVTALGGSLIEYVYDGCRTPDICIESEQINAIGKLTWAELPAGPVTYEYDARGNAITEEREFHVPGLAQYHDTRTVRRTFADHGGVWFQSYADGTSEAMSNVFGDVVRSTGATVTATEFDARGLPKRVGWMRGISFGPLATLARNAAGMPVERVSVGQRVQGAFGSGPTTAPPQTCTWKYDALGRVISDVVKRGSAESPVALVDYYPTGDLKTLTSIMGHTVDYTYDTRHQIRRATELTANDATLSDLTYTRAGRIATATVRGATNGTPRVRERSVVYEYANDPSRPEELDVMRNTTGGDAYASFAYDGDGATTERTLHHPVDPQLDKTWGMVYDGTGRLRILRRPGGGSEVYWYDHTGQRMLALERTNTGDPVKLRLWMGGTEVHYDGDGKETKTWAHVSLAGPAARIENRTDVEFTYHNGLGHLVLATKADGTDAMAYSYTAFGEVFDQKGDDPDAHLRRFNGKDVDAESGLAYYGFRYYDPVAMQWTRADPLFRFVPDMAFAEPRRANLYVFTLNNAMRYLDPDGLNPGRDLSDSGLTFGQALQKAGREGMDWGPMRREINRQLDSTAGRAAKLGARWSPPGRFVAFWSMVGDGLGNYAGWVFTGDYTPMRGDEKLSSSSATSRPSIRINLLPKTKRSQRRSAKQRRADQRAKTHSDKYGNPDYEQPASESYARWQARQLEVARGKDARRRAHDAKRAGEGDRSKRQLKDDYGDD